MSTPSRSVWSGRPSRPQSGARAAAGSSAMPNIPAAPAQPATPAQPTDSVQPAAPAQPTTTPQPEVPTTPTTPAAPVDPTPKPPVRSSSDDIILPSFTEPKPKSNNKKPLIIGAIIAGVVIVACLAFLAIKNNNSDENLDSSVSVSADSAKGKFNIYANYLLYGKDSADDIGTYSKNKTYTFDSVISGEYNETDLNDETTAYNYSETESSYFNTIKTLFDDFYNFYSSEQSEPSEAVSDYKDTVEFIYTYNNFTSPSSNELFNAAGTSEINLTSLVDSDLENLPNKSNSPLAKFYQKFYDLKSDYGNSFANYNIIRDEANVGLLRLYKTAGCNILDETELAECLTNVKLSEDASRDQQNIAGLIEQIEQDLSDMVDAASVDIVKNCWEVKGEL